MDLLYKCEWGLPVPVGQRHVWCHCGTNPSLMGRALPLGNTLEGLQDYRAVHPNHPSPSSARGITK